MSGGPSRPLLSICIVNWQTRELLRACLRALANHPPERATEIIVVDNASTDGSAEMVASKFPQVRLLRNDANLGYARATNQALGEARGDLLLLLNPDAEVRAGALAAICRFMGTHPDAGAAGCRLLNPDGTVQRSCRSFPTPGALFLDVIGLWRLFPGNRVLGRYRMTWFDHAQVAEVDQPMASALCLRRAAIERVGALDEQFPIFWNDVDLCWRLRAAGWKAYFCPDAQVVHRLGASTRQARARVIVDSHRGLIRFYRKHYRGRIAWPVYALAVAAIWLALWPRWAMARMRGGLPRARERE